MSRVRLCCFGLLFVVGVSAAAFGQSKGEKSEAGSEACVSCHAEIYRTYSTTRMATASGSAAAGVIAGEFIHKPSGVHYRVYLENGRAWMSYERPSEGGLSGRRELLYYIGSGEKGRSYIFSVQGFLFESPINWYSQEHSWNMTPAYTDAREIPLNLPALTDCMNCHTSGLERPIAGTESKYPGKPFSHAGITCQRCHGTAAGHSHNSDRVINPAKLAPELRDSVCMECHFEGTAAVKQPGKDLSDFQPGENLSDYIHYFLRSKTSSESALALSQFEALSLSACKRASGDKMSCTSCHDPHMEPSAAEKPAYYRAKCLACHGEPFAAKHHADKPRCTQCHMPLLPNQAVAHTQSTDHRIMKYPVGFDLPDKRANSGDLVAFPKSAANLTTSRDTALAWEALAQRNMEGASAEAEKHLRTAVQDDPNDPALLSALGFIDQQHGRDKDARELYERALKVDPLANDAATNLGILEAREGTLTRAVKLWQGAFERVPNRSEIGIDLAIAFCTAHQVDEARKYIKRTLDFNPDSNAAKHLLGHLNLDPPKCTP